MAYRVRYRFAGAPVFCAWSTGWQEHQYSISELDPRQKRYPFRAVAWRSAAGVREDKWDFSSLP